MKKFFRLFLLLTTTCAMLLTSCFGGSIANELTSHSKLEDVEIVDNVLPLGSVEALNGASEINGDINGDGEITNADALMIFKHLFNPEKYPITSGDLNDDGEITNADALLIFKYIFNPKLYPVPSICQHEFGDWETVKPVTCNEDGKLVRSCTKCSKTEEDVLEGGHIYTSTAVLPSSSEQGYTKYVCGRCSDTYRAEYIPALARPRC